MPEKEQFQLGDNRSLDEVINEMNDCGFLTSFCTTCYRSKRTGKDFMCVAKPGNIQNYCEANGVLTFKEYLLDYASTTTKNSGERLIQRELEKIKVI